MEGVAKASLTVVSFSGLVFFLVIVVPVFMEVFGMSVTFQLGNRKIVRSGGTYMCTCMFNYLLGQLGMGTTITRNETKRNGLFLVTLKT